MRRILFTIVIVLLVEALGLAVLLFTGAYNVSTAQHDEPFVNWWFDTGMTRSVKAHARRIPVPELDNPAKVQEGFKHFNEMCVQCHGAPGKSPDEIAKGLWPRAPDLAKAAPDWTPEQLFWITKNGIKFTAMPGWGETHDDPAIWEITAFLQKLPKLSAEDYRQMESNTVGTREDHH